MEMDGRACVSLARAPKVDEAENIRDAARTLVRVERRRGSESGVWGRPSSDSSWSEKVSIAVRNASLLSLLGTVCGLAAPFGGFDIKTPPH